MTTSFVTRTPPSGSNGGQALVLDLQEAYELALVTGELADLICYVVLAALQDTNR